jgi:hypothetical protein
MPGSYQTGELDVISWIGADAWITKKHLIAPMLVTPSVAKVVVLSGVIGAIDIS